MPKGFYMSICRNRTTNCQRSLNRFDRSDNDGTLAIGLTEVALAGILGDIFQHSAEGLALIVGTIVITDEIKIHFLLLKHNLLHTQLFAIDSEGNHTDQFLCNIGG